jgi:hypothetical protein
MLAFSELIFIYKRLHGCGLPINVDEDALQVTGPVRRISPCDGLLLYREECAQRRYRMRFDIISP